MRKYSFRENSHQWKDAHLGEDACLHVDCPPWEKASSLEEEHSEDALVIKYKLESTQEPDSYFFLSLKRLLSYFSESVNQDCLKSWMKGRDKAALIRCPPCASFLPCTTNTSQKPGKGRGTSAIVLVKDKRRCPAGAQGTQEARSFTRGKKPAS